MNASFETANRAALAALPAVLARWLPHGRRDGHEYVALNPKRPDRHLGSFRINLGTGKWADFATGDKGGDPVSLAAYLFDLTQIEAAHRLSDMLGLPDGIAKAPMPLPRVSPPAPTPRDEDAFTPIEPPADAEPPNAHHKLGRYSYRWPYIDADGALQGFVCRFETATDKVFRPLRYGTRRGRTGWHWVGWGESRPLYRLPDLLARPDAVVLVVEGEKAADAAAAILPNMVVASPMNGAQSPHRTDWGPVAGRTVLIWPDADEPGRAFARKVGQLAKAAGAAMVRIAAAPDGAPDGWDLADALPDGWTGETVRRALAEAERFEPDGSELAQLDLEALATAVLRSPTVRAIWSGKRSYADASTGHFAFAAALARAGCRDADTIHRAIVALDQRHGRDVSKTVRPDYAARTIAAALAAEGRA